VEECRRVCIEGLVEGGFQRVVDAIRTLIRLRRLGPVDRLGFALDRRVALEAFTEVMRVFDAVYMSAKETEEGRCCEAEDSRCLVKCPARPPRDDEVRRVVYCLESPCWREFVRALVAEALAEVKPVG